MVPQCLRFGSVRFGSHFAVAVAGSRGNSQMTRKSHFLFSLLCLIHIAKCIFVSLPFEFLRYFLLFSLCTSDVFCFTDIEFVDRGSSVGIVTSYRLDGQKIESRGGHGYLCCVLLVKTKDKKAVQPRQRTTYG